MEPFSEMLQVGGRRNSLGRTPEVIELVLAERGRLDELVACVAHEDAWVRMRAIDGFEKVVNVQPDWAGPYVPWIVEELTQQSQPSIQWHVAQLLAQVELMATQRAAGIEWLCGRLADDGVDWIVAVNAMRTLLVFEQVGAVEAGRLLPLFEGLGQHHSKTVRRKVAEFVEELTARMAGG